MSNEITLNTTSSSLSAQPVRSAPLPPPDSTRVNGQDLGVNKMASQPVPPPPKPAEAPAAADVSKQIEEQVQKLQELMDSNNWSVNFSVDEESGNTVIRIRDAATKEVIRQVPSEEWLKMSENIQSSLESKDRKAISGLLFDNRA